MTSAPPMPPVQPALPFEEGLEDAFMRFHMNNPQVYAALVEKARQWKDADHAHGSIKMFWEAVRFDLGVKTKGDAKFKLNNNLHSRYARLIMRHEADLAGFFETRELQTT